MCTIWRMWFEVQSGFFFGSCSVLKSPFFRPYFQYWFFFSRYHFISRELNELRKPTSDNVEILRFFKYMRAARDGQDGKNCHNTFKKCSSSTDTEQPVMLTTYNDINKLVQARELHWTHWTLHTARTNICAPFGSVRTKSIWSMFISPCVCVCVLLYKWTFSIIIICVLKWWKWWCEAKHLLLVHFILHKSLMKTDCKCKIMIMTNEWIDVFEPIWWFIKCSRNRGKKWIEKWGNFQLDSFSLCK